MPVTTDKTASRLTDAQLVILNGAAQRETRRVLPTPDSLAVKGAALERTLASLLKRGLVAEEAAAPDDPVWRGAEDGVRLTLVLTDTGLRALGIDVAADEPADADRASDRQAARASDENAKGTSAKDSAATDPAIPFRPGSKGAAVAELLLRPGGASLAEMVEATGWQPHSVRGFLSGTLGRKHGLAVTSEVEDGVRCYRISG